MPISPLAPVCQPVPSPKKHYFLTAKQLCFFWCGIPPPGQLFSQYLHFTAFSH